MILTSENYFSKEAGMEYLSVSQYKDFCGTLGRPACEEQAVEKLLGRWHTKKTTALLVGSYVDAYFEGTLDLFRSQNPSIFTKQATLKVEYKKAKEIISRIERDELFMNFMSGDKQVIMTAELYGAKWKVKLDSLVKHKCIVDLKVVESLRKAHWTKDFGMMDFIRYWGYDVQAAVYQEAVYQNIGEKLPFFIAAASKEKATDIEVIQIPQSWMDERLVEVEQNVPRIIMLKSGAIDPIRCETCDYCKHTKVLKKPIWPDELLVAV